MIKLSELKENGSTTCQLVVEDDGIGIPKNVEFQNTKSLGMQLVNSLTGQLGGNVKMRNSNGTCYEISFNTN